MMSGGFVYSTSYSGNMSSLTHSCSESALGKSSSSSGKNKSSSSNNKHGGDMSETYGDDDGGNNNNNNNNDNGSDGQTQAQTTMTQPSQSSSSSQVTLLQAVINGDVRKVRKMVVKGISANEANERDPQGRSPLAVACGNGMVLTVEFLSFIPNLDPNKQDNEGNTPLILAAQAGHVDCIRILLKEFRNVRLDHQNRKGYTALIQAAINGRTDCAKILMEAGANPFFHDKVRKKNALQWAEFCGRTPCAAAIKEMTGRFPAVVRHLVQAGQSVLVRHKSIWGSDTEINRIAERENMTKGKVGERRGTISRLLQRSAKWIRSLSKRRKSSYKSLSALVSVSLAISGPAVARQMLHSSPSGPDEENKSPYYQKSGKPTKSKTHHHHGPNSPTFRIPEVQIIAPSDEYCRRISLATPMVTAAPPVAAKPPVPDGDASNCAVCASCPSCPPPIASSGGGPNSVVTAAAVASAMAANQQRNSNKDVRSQTSSAPTSPVLSSRSADRAHRLRFAQRSAATTTRQATYHYQTPTAYATTEDYSDDDQLVMGASGSGSCVGDDSSIEEEDEEENHQTDDGTIFNFMNTDIPTATTTTAPQQQQQQQQQQSPLTKNKPY